MRKYSSILLIVVAFLGVQACATKLTSAERVELERRERAYDRFVNEHRVGNRQQLERPGIYYYRRAFYVVISLTASGTDSYAEWAGEKLVSSLVGYRIVDKDEVSLEQFASLILDFEIAGTKEEGRTTIVQVRIPERSILEFRKALDRR
jgi:hypothetical protein